jgi:hypothetical protein
LISEENDAFVWLLLWAVGWRPMCWSGPSASSYDRFLPVVRGVRDSTRVLAINAAGLGRDAAAVMVKGLSSWGGFWAARWGRGVRGLLGERDCKARRGEASAWMMDEATAGTAAIARVQ